jgi:hypothetical protein
MQKFMLLIGSLCTLVVLGIGLSSCKDDEPFVKPNLSVSTETLSVAEAAGTIEVEIVLDRAAPSDITVEYDLGGTATSPADYSIVGTEGEVEIAQGQTSAVIQIQIVSDALYEGDETIEVSLQDVDSDDIVITNDDEAVITITDDDPQLKASFSTTTLTVAESDNTELLEVEVVLDNPAPQDVTIQFTLANGAGMALDSLYAANLTDPIPSQYYDYYIEGALHEVTIALGATSGVIQIQLLSDFHFEDDETIEITLTEASTGVEIGTNNKMTITVEQEDGMAIALVWDDVAYTDVDMDLFLWIGANISDLFFAASSTNPSVTEKVEALFIPAVINDPDGVAFGTSYTYWGGTADPMNFEARFIEFVDGVVEPEAEWDVYPGTYTLANINKWDDTNSGITPVIAQTFRKVAGAFVEITDPIVAPATGSRMATVALPQGVKKMKASAINKARKF